MKVGIYSPYLDTLGGGERYVLTVAEYFLDRNDTVDIFWKDSGLKAKIEDRFNINISKANFTPNFKTFGYDLIFFLSDGSLPLSLAKKTIVHFQNPFTYPNQETLLNKIKLSRINFVVCNSEFTKSFIDKCYGVDSEVLYPPVDTQSFLPGKKENLILSVGRFGNPQFQHSKKQDILINAFATLKLKNWKLVLLGGLKQENKNYFESLKKKAKDLPIEIVSNPDFKNIRDYYSKAKFFWHAAGFGEDQNLHPEKVEHFGITTVESMSAGCVPLVFNGGGQREIITSGKNGYLWNTEEELVNQTKTLIGDQKHREEIAKQAIGRSADFSKQVFFQKLAAFVK